MVAIHCGINFTIKGKIIQWLFGKDTNMVSTTKKTVQQEKNHALKWYGTLRLTNVDFIFNVYIVFCSCVQIALWPQRVHWRSGNERAITCWRLKRVHLFEPYISTITFFFVTRLICLCHLKMNHVPMFEVYRIKSVAMLSATVASPLSFRIIC